METVSIIYIEVAAEKCDSSFGKDWENNGVMRGMEDLLYVGSRPNIQPVTASEAISKDISEG